VRSSRSAFVHWLANRGYGVMYVNFRGSAGFGKKYMNAQIKWEARCQDVLDQVDWAVREGIADPKRVAILGGSYGGYEVLVAMTMTPDVFACGISWVRRASRSSCHMGRRQQARVRAILAPKAARYCMRVRRSTSHRTRKSCSDRPRGERPGWGFRSHRVMQEHGVAVTYLLYPDEGHGLLRPENSFSFWAVSEAFLAQCLGGRSSPIGDALNGSSLQVPVGAERIPGLPEALAKRTAAQ
jgi:dienelactone hydrolase